MIKKINDIDNESRNLLMATSLVVILVVSIIFSIVGCNAFSSLDKAKEPIDKYKTALALADSGDCVGAKDLLVAITTPDDNVRIALGWAYLCMGGATASKIASSIYKYSSGSSDFTVVGALARSMLPMSSEKISHLNSAASVFNQIYDVRIRNLELGIAKFVKASAILSNQSVNAASTGSLTRDDIGPSACLVSDCVASGAACTGGTQISDTNVDDFFTSITEAATALSASGADSLRLLANAIRNGQGATQANGRCFIYNSAISATE